MWGHLWELLDEGQGLRCAINGVPLELRPGCAPEDKWRQASLDAINPRKGHVTGNLRWICLGFNNTNSDRRKKDGHVDDAPTAWTEELWHRYARIGH
jgi:hypothetical protein